LKKPANTHTHTHTERERKIPFRIQTVLVLDADWSTLHSSRVKHTLTINHWIY